MNNAAAEGVVERIGTVDDLVAEAFRPADECVSALRSSPDGDDVALLVEVLLAAGQLSSTLLVVRGGNGEDVGDVVACGHVVRRVHLLVHANHLRTVVVDTSRLGGLNLIVEQVVVVRVHGHGDVGLALGAHVANILQVVGQ